MPSTPTSAPTPCSTTRPGPSVPPSLPLPLCLRHPITPPTSPLHLNNKIPTPKPNTHSRDLRSARRTTGGSITDDDDDTADDAAAARRHYQTGSAALLRQYERRVQATTAEYTRAMGELLTLLRAQEQESDAVRFLMFRLDFNEYYGRTGFGGLLEDAATTTVGGGGGTTKSVRMMV